jgi:hypothetical protein
MLRTPTGTRHCHLKNLIAMSRFDIHRAPLFAAVAMAALGQAAFRYDAGQDTSAMKVANSKTKVCAAVGSPSVHLLKRVVKSKASVASGG